MAGRLCSCTWTASSVVFASCGALVRIALSYGQCISTLLHFSRVRWPSPFRSFLEAIEVITSIDMFAM